jgi:hypothetical protein
MGSLLAIVLIGMLIGATGVLALGIRKSIMHRAREQEIHARRQVRPVMRIDSIV